MFLRIAIPFAAALAMSGCANLSYYGQAIGGQLDVMTRARPIDKLLQQPDLDPDVRDRLSRIVEIREYAVRELGLPDSDSYRRYADLERPFALWNVFATPELSLDAKRWCYPIAGCMSYRSYYSKEGAELAAQALRAQGYDVHVGGVSAYSTSGWFGDPVLNTMIKYPEPEMAGIVFHELAHETVYAPGDTAFNESFASAVEREGVRRWLASQGASDQYTAYLARAKRHEDFIALVMRYRERLNELYRSAADDAYKRRRKAELFEEMQAEYAELKKTWNGYGGYDRWVSELNNAKFLSVGLYNTHVPAFQALLARHQGDLRAFYREAKQLAKLGSARRNERLAQLASDAGRVAALPRDNDASKP